MSGNYILEEDSAPSKTVGNKKEDNLQKL